MTGGGWQEFLMVAGIHLLAVASPGPDFTVTLRQTLRHGRIAGIATALGIGAGILVHVGYSLMGLGAVIYAYPVGILFLKIVGATYLLYLAGMMLRAAWRKWANTSQHIDEAQLTGDPSLKQTKLGSNFFFTGFFINITNPKAGMFFLALYSSLVSVDTSWHIKALYGVWMCAVNIIWFSAVAILFARSDIRRVWLARDHWFETALAAVLIFFAGQLLFSLAMSA